MFGAAYLSLVSIALVVPTNPKVKWAITPFVILGAYVLALLSKNQAQETYLCTLSIFGTFIGVTLQAHLKSSSTR